MIEDLKTDTALAFENDRLALVARDPPHRFVWFWQSPQGLVVPKPLSRKPQFPAAQAALSAKGWPVHVRGTGGDVTPTGPGLVTVSHVYVTPSEPPFDLDTAYLQLCAPIIAALGEGAGRGWMPGAFCDGAHNVLLDGKKFAGTAMRFRPCPGAPGRFAILAHALMLYTPVPDAAIEAMNLLLSFLEEDRQIDPHVHQGLPADTDTNQLSALIRDGFAAQHATPLTDTFIPTTS